MCEYKAYEVKKIHDDSFILKSPLKIIYREGESYQAVIPQLEIYAQAASFDEVVTKVINELIFMYNAIAKAEPYRLINSNEIRRYQIFLNKHLEKRNN